MPLGTSRLLLRLRSLSHGTPTECVELVGEGGRGARRGDARMLGLLDGKRPVGVVKLGAPMLGDGGRMESVEGGFLDGLNDISS